MDYPDVVQLAVPVFIVAIAIELTWIMLTGRGGRYETRDAVTSLIMGAGNVTAGILLGFIAWGFFMVLWQLTPLDLGHSWWIILFVLCAGRPALLLGAPFRPPHPLGLGQPRKPPFVAALQSDHGSQANLDLHLHLHDGRPEHR